MIQSMHSFDGANRYLFRGEQINRKQEEERQKVRMKLQEMMIGSQFSIRMDLQVV